MILGISVYYWVIILTVGLAFLLQGNRKGSTFYILLVCAFLFLLLGFRDANSIGGDRLWYIHYFEDLEGMQWEDYSAGKFGSYNWLFNTLIKVVYDYSGADYQSFVMLLAVIVMASVFRLIRKYSVSPVLSFLCFFGFLYYTLMFSALKQSAAMAIIMWAFDAIIERRPVRFVALVLLASSFHFPALVFLPAYWISKMRFGKNYLLFLVALLLLVFLFREQVVSFMKNSYGKDESISPDASARFLANKVLVMLLIVFVGLQLRPASVEGDEVYNALLQLMGVSIVLQTFSSYGNIFERLADYYYQFVILFMPMIFEKQQNVKSRLSPSLQVTVRAFGPLFVGAFAVWRFLNYVSDNANFTPFYFYFNAPEVEPELLIKMIFI